MIYVNVPYYKGDLSKGYNNFMSKLDSGDWACFIDEDVLLCTSPNWYPTMEKIIYENPDGGLFTCVTNRIGNPEQLIPSHNVNNHDITFHKKVGKELSDLHGTSVKRARGWTSLLLALTSFDVWKKCGGFVKTEHGMLGVDNEYDKSVRNAGYVTYIMQGVYLYHWYRGDGTASFGECVPNL